MGTQKWLSVLVSHPEPYSLGLLSLLTLTLEPFWGQEEALWRSHTFSGLLSLPCSHSHALPHLPWKHILNEPNLRQLKRTSHPTAQPAAWEGRAGMRRGWLQEQRLDRLQGVDVGVGGTDAQLPKDTYTFSVIPIKMPNYFWS